MELDDGDEDDGIDDNIDDGDEAFAVSFCRRQVVSCIGANGFTTKEKEAEVQSTSSRHHPRHSYRETLRMV